MNTSTIIDLDATGVEDATVSAESASLALAPTVGALVAKERASASLASTAATSSWPEADVTFLKENALLMSYATIARHIGRTREAVCAKANRLGIGKINHLSSADRSRGGRAAAKRRAKSTKPYLAGPRTPSGPTDQLLPLPVVETGVLPSAATGILPSAATGAALVTLPAPEAAQNAHTPCAEMCNPAWVHPDDRHIKTKPLRKLAENECRWPIGDPQSEKFGYCGCKKSSGNLFPYCDQHAKRAFRAPTPRRSKVLIHGAGNTSRALARPALSTA